MRARNIVLIFVASILVMGVTRICEGAPARVNSLMMNFYNKTCPDVETIVRDITWRKVADNTSLRAKLLRMHYHDCFVRGCDGSILLDRVNDVPSEKEAIPNLTLFGFEVIDEIKEEIEKVCPGVVSCADILTLTARDAVSFLAKKPLWPVFLGRKDGRVSLKSEVLPDLPSPFSNFSTLMDMFSRKGLDVKDLVALSGAHTFGRAHCASFSRRLRNFAGTGDADPSLDPTYADFLRSQCPIPANPETTVEMDPESSLIFDNHYYNILLENKGLFQSDATLLTDERSAEVARKFMSEPTTFMNEFSKSVKNMGAMDVLIGDEGEIRRKCNMVN